MAEGMVDDLFDFSGGRRSRRKKKENPLAGLVGIIVVGIVLLAARGASGADFDIFKLLGNLILIAVVVGAIALAIKFFFGSISNLFDTIFRKSLYKKFSSLEELRQIHPQQFEEYIAAVYQNKGYAVDTVTPYSRDHGIDVMVRKKGKKYAIQVKRYGESNYVKAKEVREFYGSYIGDGFDGGIFVTTSFYGQQAREWAEERGMELVDGPQLLKMMNRVG